MYKIILSALFLSIIVASVSQAADVDTLFVQHKLEILRFDVSQDEETDFDRRYCTLEYREGSSCLLCSKKTIVDASYRDSKKDVSKKREARGKEIAIPKSGKSSF